MSDVWLISTPQSTQIMETKKTWEYVSLRAYPNTQAFALPLSKDKQRKPAHASDYIHIHYGLVIPEWRITEPRIYESTDPFLRIYTLRACTFVGCTPYYIYKGEW